MGDWRRAYGCAANDDVEGLIALREDGQQITLPDPISLCNPIFVAVSSSGKEACNFMYRGSYLRRLRRLTNPGVLGQPSCAILPLAAEGGATRHEQQDHQSA